MSLGVWRRKAFESESGLSKVRWEEFVKKSIWGMRKMTVSLLLSFVIPVVPH